MKISQRLRLLALSIAVILITFLSGCDDGDPKVRPAEYILLNNLNNKANISLYDHNKKALTESIYTFQSQFYNPIYNAAKKDNHVVMVTAGTLKLVKVDISSGEEVGVVDAWVSSRPFIGFHNTNIIVCEAQVFDNRLPFITKIYSEDLVLLDSLSETGVMDFDAATIVDNELFYSVVVADQGVFIKAKNLNTTQTRSVEISHRCQHLVSLGDSKLLAAAGDRYFIIDTSSMSVVETVSESVTYPVMDTKTNALFYLKPAAQPSAVTYYLSKLNLTTGEQTVLTTDEAIMPPLFYDAETDLIVSGGLKVFSRKGEVLHTMSVPATTTHIFKK
jgi:hypothetical protein